jgi:hypothetical protein
MTLEQVILDAVRELPADEQRDLLDHVKRLRDEATQPQKPRKNGRGLWADLNIDLSAEFGVHGDPGIFGCRESDSMAAYHRHVDETPTIYSMAVIYELPGVQSCAESKIA